MPPESGLFPPPAEMLHLPLFLHPVSRAFRLVLIFPLPCSVIVCQFFHPSFSAACVPTAGPGTWHTADAERKHPSGASKILVRPEKDCDTGIRTREKGPFLCVLFFLRIGPLMPVWYLKLYQTQNKGS